MDRYQTTTHVILNIMIKNLKESDVKVKLIDETLDVTCSLADGNEFKLHFNLFKSIYVSESNWTVTPSKLEIKLKKTDRKRWQSLEVLPDKTGKRPLSFVGFVQPNATKKANTAITRVNTSLVDDSLTAPFLPKYDWHQNQNNVIISIHIPNLTETDVKVEFSETTLLWSCKVDDLTTYNVKLSLFKPIIVELSNWKLTVSKLEITLRKRDVGRWPNLEAVSQTIKSTNWPQIKTTLIETEPEPSSSGIDQNIQLIDNNGVVCSDNTNDVESNNKTFNYTLVSLEPTDILVDDNHCVAIKGDDKVLQNLDKIVTDFKEREAKSVEGGVDELLREIYEKGGEEVRTAINKKFNENSGQSLEDNKESKLKTDEEIDGKTQIDLTDEVCGQSSHTMEEPNV